ncbi:MAG: MBL fold metallo-hydrolase [Parvularculaceae bacterium]
MLDHPDRRAARLLFVDPGGEPDKIMAGAEQMGAKIEKIWLTHGHLDHAGAAEEIKRRTGAPIEGRRRKKFSGFRRSAGRGANSASRTAKVARPTVGLKTATRWSSATLNFPSPTRRGIRPAISSSTIRARASPLSATCCSPDRSGARIFRAAIARHDKISTEKLWPLGDDMRFVPGHGPVSTFGRERQSNPFVADRLTGYKGAATTAPDAAAQDAAKRQR